MTMKCNKEDQERYFCFELERKLQVETTTELTTTTTTTIPSAKPQPFLTQKNHDVSQWERHMISTMVTMNGDKLTSRNLIICMSVITLKSFSKRLYLFHSVSLTPARYPEQMCTVFVFNSTTEVAHQAKLLMEFLKGIYKE